MKHHLLSPIPTLVIAVLVIVLAVIGAGAEAASVETTASMHVSAAAVDLIANDLVYDAGRDLIWASVPSSGGGRGNSVTSIGRDGTLGQSIYVGSEPNKLALSDDGQFLYVGLDGTAAVRRVDLTTGTAGLQWPLGANSCGQIKVEDMVVLAGDAHAVAISRRHGCSPRHDGVAVYDDGVMRPNMTPDHTGSNVIERSATADKLYGYNNESSEFGLRVMAVNANGVTITKTVLDLIDTYYGADIRYADGRIYATSGEVVDVDTLTLAGTIPAEGLVVPDPVAGQVYFIQFVPAPLFRAFDIDTLSPLFDIQVPALAQDMGYGRAFIGIGEGMFGFIKDDGSVYLLRLFEGYEVSGHVLDNDGQPLYGVLVSDGVGHSGMTNWNGVYTFGVPAGSYTLTPALGGYTFDPPSRQVTVPPDVPGQDFVGTPPTYRISGLIVDAQQQPVAGVWVLITGGGTSPTTAADGTFEVDGLRPGSYSLRPMLQGYKFQPATWTLELPPDADITFTAIRQQLLFLPAIRK